MSHLLDFADACDPEIVEGIARVYATAYTDNPYTGITYEFTKRYDEYRVTRAASGTPSKILGRFVHFRYAFKYWMQLITTP
jgi:hypothetical protein